MRNMPDMMSGITPLIRTGLIWCIDNILTLLMLALLLGVLCVWALENGKKRRRRCK
jgi:hypothetical protein